MNRVRGVEKVRGMNAALTTNGDAPSRALTERDPARLHLGVRQLIVALLLAGLGVVAAIYTVHAVTAGDQTYPATVTSSQVYQLNFPNTGRVTLLAVKPGQQITSGQVLARQDATTLQAAVLADQAAVGAAAHQLAQARHPQTSPAQQQQDVLQVQQQQAALSNATTALTAAESTGQAQVSAAQQTVVADQQLVSTDTARYQQACPAGPVAPAPGLVGSAWQSAQGTFTNCQNLQFQLDKDTSALTQAQAQVPIAAAQAKQAVDQQQAAVNTAQAALAVAQQQQAVQSAPANAAGLAQAEATLNQADSQLRQAQQAVQEAVLLAPASGTVMQVSGAVGEYLGGDGVRQYSGPAALPTNQQPSFDLFPAAAGSSANGSSTAATLPLIEVMAGPQQITAQVNESAVSHFTVGHHATVRMNATDVNVPATAVGIILNPARTATAVTYDVILNLDHPLTGLLPGMSATVRSG